MGDYTFRKTRERYGRLPGIFDEQMIKREPQLYSCNIEHARRLGGGFTSDILDKIEPSMFGENWIIDTRVHMLMPGFYPAIPGWHCDAVPRDPSTGQPLLDEWSKSGPHFQMIIASRDRLSQTEFIDEDVSVGVDPDRVWGSVDAEIKKRYPNPCVYRLAEGEIVRFSSADLHRATPTIGSGWRFFFRASQMATTPRNEVRTQSQVYCDLGGGW